MRGLRSSCSLAPNHVGGFTLIPQRDRGGEDLLVGVGVEVLKTEDAQHVGDALVVAKHRAEDGALGVVVLRGQAGGGFVLTVHGRAPSGFLGFRSFSLTVAGSSLGDSSAWCFASAASWGVGARLPKPFSIAVGMVLWRR